MHTWTGDEVAPTPCHIMPHQDAVRASTRGVALAVIRSTCTTCGCAYNAFARSKVIRMNTCWVAG